MLRAFLPLLFLTFSAVLHAQPLQPFQASYTADWKQLPFTGTAERSLRQQADGNWELTFKASMLVAGVSESSIFRLQDNQLQPLHYKYDRTGLGKPKKSRQSFDWSTLQVSGKDKDGDYQLPLHAGVLDKSSYQLALQQDVAQGADSLSYIVLDGDDLDTYDFRILGDEAIETPLGTLNTVKVERVRDPGQNKRKTTLWFARDWGYLLVQLNQVERDGKEYTIMLQDGRVNGQPVRGLAR
ncbi:uncharacterized protein DUF3108 [Thiopseudomonas denitrificans]|uniref:Uncharacterized protein DUF3108 n=1 Tax=Thiopseudomonas denitrificans TaxID=1501432 RepID=A0A4R6TSV8_9GAMM|nr:DUF3108 domain-containing protein [Thiopseudomonas denitrificans]TDQ36156.1 uncharacterized protein DUF3108 [Thiopseudomonas denitrificans]